MELGRNPVSKHEIQPEYGDEQADAGRDCRLHLARPNFPAANGDREISIFPVQLTTSRMSNLTRLILTLLAIYVTIHIPGIFYSNKNVTIYIYISSFISALFPRHFARRPLLIL